MASELAPQESLIPKERPDTPEFQAQVDRSKLKSQVWREILLDTIKIQTEVVPGTWNNFPAYYLNTPAFNPLNTEQYLPDSISQDTIEILKNDRDNIISWLENSITKSYNHTVSPWIHIESGEVEWFLGAFFTTQEQVWEYYYGKAYYQAQEFNHKIGLLPESTWLVPIDISADRLGKSISQWYRDFEAEFLNFSTFDDYIRQYAGLINMESIPGRNTNEYLNLCSDALNNIEYRFRDYKEARDAFYGLPENIRWAIDYDIEQALEKISGLRNECIKVLLEDDGEWGYRGIQFDWNLSKSEVQIAQYWLEQADTISVLNQAMKSLPVNEQWYITQETINNAGGILGYFLQHPNEKIWKIISYKMEEYSSSAWIRNRVDWDFWNSTLLLVAVYQYQKFWDNYSRITGRLDRETMLLLAQEAKQGL